MKNALKYALGVLFPALLSSQALACYTVYNRSNQVIYQSMDAPVDMRYQLHQTVPAVFPDGHLVFSITDTNCPRVNSSRNRSIDMTVVPLSTRAPRQSRG